MVETDDGPWWEVDGQRVSPSGRKASGFILAEAFVVGHAPVVEGQVYRSGQML